MFICLSKSFDCAIGFLRSMYLVTMLLRQLPSPRTPTLNPPPPPFKEDDCSYRLRLLLQYGGLVYLEVK